MPVFDYVAKSDGGQMVEGTLSAADRNEAAKIIRQEGSFPVKITAAGGAKSRTKLSNVTIGGPGRERYRADDLIFFTSQMAVMVETGVSLSEALEACVHEGNSPRFARALTGVIAKVQAGRELSAAMAEYPTVFPTLYVSLIRASEASGQLGPIMKRLAEHLDRQRALTKKIKGAITYPIVMIVFAIGTTIFLVTYVLPKFAEIYKGREDSLPKLTRVLLAVSDWIGSYGIYVGLVLLAGGIASFFYLRTPNGRIFKDKLKLSMPILGPLYHKTYLARSLRTLGTMIQSGVSMLEGVRLTTKVCDSIQYENLWKNVNERIEAGRQISEALEQNKHIPRSILKMLGAGERSGQLGTVMGRVATFCEDELNQSIKTITSMIEPAIVAFLGVVVGGLVLAMLLPIFTISKAMH
ncbi:MAG TPA: type II secretion system F family protein [Phycisphaerae bacterium]|nr:type II secretion system F family protein [Phycisphaerae bacterium]HRW53920.1 type II secretion system F family protein [Phycisphaerae bacterium]